MLSGGVRISLGEESKKQGASQYPSVVHYMGMTHQMKICQATSATEVLKKWEGIYLTGLAETLEIIVLQKLSPWKKFPGEEASKDLSIEFWQSAINSSLS